MNPLRKQATHIVESMTEAQRLSDYVVGIFEQISSRKGIKKAIKKGLVFVNNRVGHTGDWIQGGEEIVLYKEQTKSKVLQYDIRVLYEDDEMAAVYKPAEILVNGNHHFTLERALPYNLMPSYGIDSFSHPLPVHRLDFETAGIVLIAKTRRALTYLQEQFMNHTIEKKYLAICCGRVEKSGIINNPVENKEAVTKFELLDEIDSKKYGSLSLVAFYPVTGRTHQIRIHAAGMGSPILGDKLYHKGVNQNYTKCHMLLAQSISFINPAKNKLVLSSPIPKRMLRFFHEALISYQDS